MVSKKKRKKEVHNTQYSWNGAKAKDGKGKCRKASITRQCSRKKRYKDHKHAQSAVKLIKVKMRYYYCEICQGYHLTRQEWGDFTVKSNKEKDL